MRLLIIDASGSALDLAVRAQADGHIVKHFIRQTPKTEHIGRGMVDLISDYMPWVKWADLIFLADNTRYLIDTDRARAEGKVVFGPSRDSAQWELNRSIGMQVFRKAGINTPPVKVFNDYDQAIAYVKRNDRRFVSKPSGSDDKALSYCAKSAKDMVYMLQRWKKADKLKGAEFILQDFIDGTEMAVGGWFGPHGFNEGWCENWEFKKLMNNDLGVATGEQGTIIRYVSSSKLANKVLKPLVSFLKRINYIGYIDVNCIIDSSGNPWPLEFTMRPGWPTFNIQQALHSGDCIEWMKDLAIGKDSKVFIQDMPAIGVVLSIPDYPYSHLTRKEVIGIPAYGCTDARLSRHIHPCEMMMGEAPNDEFKTEKMPVTAGDYVLVMSASGPTIQACRQTVYGRLKKLEVPNSPMYRTDIGVRLKKQLPILQAQGYALGLEWDR